MNISASTLLTSQSALSPAKPSVKSDPATEFAPLLFKKTAATPVEMQTPTASAPPTKSAPTPSFAAATAAPGAYQRPGSTIDIKV